MGKLALTLFLVVAASFGREAFAAPTAYYNPATGGIHLKNDTERMLAVISIFSETIPNAAKSDPALYASIPGALFDSGDLPLGFSYLSFPQTGGAPFGLFIGNVIAPGTPARALTGVWYWPLHDPITQPRVAIVEIPEPSTGIIAILAVMGGAVALRSHTARRSNHSLRSAACPA